MSNNINLKNLLNRLFDVREHIEDIYRSLKYQIGSDADFIREWCDLRRVEAEGETSKELEGDALFEELLQYCWKSGKDYVWHYKGSKFRITPFRSGTTDDGGFIFYYGEKHSLVNFSGVVRDAVETDCSVWEIVAARMHGLADGYASASLQNPEVLKEAVKEGRLEPESLDQTEPKPDNGDRIIRAGGDS